MTASDAVRDLILLLADSKRLLGMRYGEWILGAPELEAGIACASMAQDEWGHSRLLYALLRDFGDDPERIEHDREPMEYRNMETLDAAADSWPALVAANVLVDGALSVQFEALRSSSQTPLAQRVAKLLDEEVFHAAHGEAWWRRLARSETGARDLRNISARWLPVITRWFGPDSDYARALVESGIMDAAGSDLRARFAELIEPLLAAVDAALPEGSPDFSGFNEKVRRTERAGPDEQTIARVRGDRNREFLLE